MGIYLTSVEHFSNIDLRNVCIYLYNIEKNAILTVIEKKNNKIGVPAGKLDKNKDQTAFLGIKREFKEETGKELPHVNFVGRYVMECNNNHKIEKTGIYICTIKYDRNNYESFNGKETRNVKYRNIDKIKRSEMRYSMEKSFPIVKKTIMTNKTLKIKNENTYKRSNCIIL
jgi:8-oxo-dGTP pyrophosphatase MutT (NUDIX family)